MLLRSTSAIGSYFERVVLHTVSTLGMRMEKVGGMGDKGVDLRGFLELGSNRFPIIIQCKHEARKTSTKYIRELEGTLMLEQPDTIGILATRSAWTSNSLTLFHHSNLPLMNIIVQPTVEGSEQWFIQNLMLNSKIQSLHPQLGVGKCLISGQVGLFYNGSEIDTTVADFPDNPML
ncbi:hypothetical protein BC833DRAFT_584484 [Globomyces pollinis-pini]|nr:hypothetical protein BC833DRAFT_584484 [Globomyces pollinis-pini]